MYKYVKIKLYIYIHIHHSPRRRKIHYPTHQVSQFHQLSPYSHVLMAIDHQNLLLKSTFLVSQFSHLLSKMIPA